MVELEKAVGGEKDKKKGKENEKNHVYPRDGPSGSQ